MTPGKAKVTIVIGALMLLYVGVLAGIHLRVALHRPIDGYVISARIDEVEGTKGVMMYTPLITYGYSVNGERYRGTRFGPLDDNAGSQEWAERILRQYQPGTRCTIYYDPSDPWDSVLTKAANYRWRWVMVLMTFLGTITLIAGILALRVRPAELLPLHMNNPAS